MYRQHQWRVPVLGLPLAAFLVWRLLRAASPNRILLVLLPLAASAMCPLICFVRDGALPYFDGYRLGWEGVRYTFVLAPFGVVSCLAAFRDRRWRWMQAGYLIIFACLAIYRFRLNPMGPERDWPPKGTLLEASRRTGVPAVVTIPLNPQGWTFTYRPPRRDAPSHSP
jgi:hypothetical protein